MYAPIVSLFEDPLPHASAEHLHGEVRFITRENFRKTFRIIVSELRVPGRGPVGFVYTLDDLTRKVTAIRQGLKEITVKAQQAA